MKWIAWSLVALLGLLALAFASLQLFFVLSVKPVEPFTPTPHEQAQLAFYQQPESWFLENLQGPREVVDGQTLDPKIQYLAEQERPGSASARVTMPIIFATPWGRAYVRNQADRAWLLMTRVTSPMAQVEDRVIEGRQGPIPIRIYRPVADGEGSLPVLVYHHGGGWIFASITASDRVARQIANEGRVIVVSVDFRLAPESRYPAASDDGEDAYLWTRRHAVEFGGDPQRVAVGGDSAGGHVAINIAQRQNAAGRQPPAAMLLYYPGAGLPQDDPSYRLFGRGYGLDSSFIEFILPRVFPGYRPDRHEEADDLMEPAGASSLAGLPPAIVATAGFDILRDSGRRFAEKLGHDGVPVRYTNYPSLTHSFLQFSGVVSDADRASSDNAWLLGRLLRSPDDAASILSEPGPEARPERSATTFLPLEQDR